MFFIVGYFPHLGGEGGVNEVWKISTQFIFFFEGFPKDKTNKEKTSNKTKESKK